MMKYFEKLRKFSALVFVISLIVLTMGVLTAGIASATESTYVVNLRERIVSDLRGLQGVQEETKNKQGDVMKMLDRLKLNYANALTEEDRNRIRLEFRKKKAEYIEADANNVIEGLKYVKSISNNIRLLNEEYKKEGEKDGLGLNKRDIALVQETLMGFDQSLAVLKSLKPDDPEYALAEQSLITMDATFKARFTGKEIDSLETMTVYLQNFETYLESMKRFLLVNAQREKIRVYGDIKNELTDWLNKVFTLKGGNITKSYQRLREMDDIMSGEDKKLKVTDSGGSVIGTGVIGRWN